MTWKDNSAHIRRRCRWECDECSYVFETRPEDGDDSVPDCPVCAAGRASYVAPMPAIGTTKGKAIDLAQEIAERDFGMTDMNDNQRTGDIAFKGPAPMQGAEADKLIREMVEYQSQTGLPVMDLSAGQAPPPSEEGRKLVDPSHKVANYWQGGAGLGATGTAGATEISRPASQEAARQGIDPVGILENAKASGNMPLRLNVMGSVDSKELPQALQEAQARRGATP